MAFCCLLKMEPIMKSKICFLFLLCCFELISAPATRASAESEQTKCRLDNLSLQLANKLKQHHVPGMAIAIHYLNERLRVYTE
jgi:hypothetical protein